MDTKVFFCKYKAVIFDLDDTIYPEIEYLKNAFMLIASTTVQLENLSSSKKNIIYRYLVDIYKSEGRDLLYQKMCKRFDLKNITLEQYLSILRTVPIENRIKLYSHITEIIKLLVKSNKLLFILTNGNPSQQKNKIDSLDIPFIERFNVIYASRSGHALQKPNPFFINKIVSEYSLKKSEIIFIGDSEIDKESANNAEIDFVYRGSLN